MASDLHGRLMNRIYAAADAQLAEVAEMGLEIAKEEVPFKTGKLKASLRIRKNRDANYSIVAGDADAPYAGIVHEDHPARGSKKGDIKERIRAGEDFTIVKGNPFFVRTASRLRGNK